MRYKVTIVGLVLLCALSSMSFKCGDGGNTNANVDPIRRAAKAADTIASSITELIKIKRQLAQEGKIKPPEELALTNALLKANTADKAFLAAIKQLKSNPSQSDKANLATLFSTVSAAVNEVDAGVLGVSDTDAKNKLNVILNTVKASLAIISSVVQP